MISACFSSFFFFFSVIFFNCEVIEKDPFTSHEDMGRQESDTSQVTTASLGPRDTTRKQSTLRCLRWWEQRKYHWLAQWQ